MRNGLGPSPEELASREINQLPPLLRNWRIENLKPSPKSRMPEAEQKQLYDAIQADPLGGWALFAPAGWSKN